MEYSNEKLLQGARNLKAKNYTPEQVDSWLKSKGSSLDNMKQFASQQNKQEKGFTDYLADNFSDIGFGMKKGLSGLTFGGSDWALRKMGIDDKDYYDRVRERGLNENVAKTAGTISEIGGNMITSNGLLKGLSNLGLKGYGLASTAGGLEGMTYGLTGSDKLEQVPLNVLLEGSLGLVGGATGEALSRGLSKGSRYLSKQFSNISKPKQIRALERLEKDIAKETGDEQYARRVVNDALKKSNLTGRSMIEVADDPIIDMAQKARQKTPKAKYILQNRLDKAKSEQPAQLRNFIDDVLGTKNRGNSIIDVTERAKKEAGPIYKQLEELGDLSKLNEYSKKKLDTLMDNPFLQDLIKKIKRPSGSLSDLADTDFRVLNEARKQLNNMTRNFDSSTSGFDARLAKSDLVNTLDELLPDYPKARKLYSDAHRFEDAAEMSKDIFSNTKTVPDFKNAVAGLTDNEKDALAIGFREDLLNKIGAQENQSLAFRKLLPENIQEKTKVALGNDVASKILEKAKEATRLNTNYNKLLQGSQTAEKQALRDNVNIVMRLLKNPFGVVGEVTEPITNIINNRRNVELAKILTNPNVDGLRSGLRKFRYIDKLYNVPNQYKTGISSVLTDRLYDEL